MHAQHIHLFQILFTTRELGDDNALINIYQVNVYRKWQRIELQWNIEMALLPKRNVFSKIDMTPRLSRPMFLPKYQAFK